MDHDHVTGLFRKIVCRSCNVMDSYIKYPNGYDITIRREDKNKWAKGKMSCICGAVVSKGFEASIVTNPIRGLNIVAGYAHNISEVTKDTPAGGYLGLRPEEAGPETLINFWANYTFLEGGLKNMSLGFGGNYASEHHTLNRANIGQFTLPSYTVLNSVIAYQWNQASIQLKVDNITNKRYFTGWSTVSPQQTRIVSLGLNYPF